MTLAYMDSYQSPLALLMVHGHPESPLRSFCHTDTPGPVDGIEIPTHLGSEIPQQKHRLARPDTAGVGQTSVRWALRSWNRRVTPPGVTYPLDAAKRCKPPEGSCTNKGIASSSFLLLVATVAMHLFLVAMHLLELWKSNLWNPRRTSLFWGKALLK